MSQPRSRITLIDKNREYLHKVMNDTKLQFNQAQNKIISEARLSGSKENTDDDNSNTN